MLCNGFGVDPNISLDRTFASAVCDKLGRKKVRGPYKININRL